MSIADKFEQFHRNILINYTDNTSIACRYKQITKRLNTDFWQSNSEFEHSLYVGSYGRDTDIHISDIDMLFWLSYDIYVKYNNYTGNGQSALLQAVRNSIQKTYNTTHIKADGQIIGLNFTDGICFEIVPCFVNKDDSFTFPDSNNGGSWKTTNPKPEIKAIKQRNREWNKNLKRLCRMTRVWKDFNNVPMGGLLIDTLAYNFLKDWTYKDKSYLYYDWMFRDFFKYLKEQDPTQNYWRAIGSNQFISRKGNFESKSARAYNLTLEAIEHEIANHEYSANLKWREVFGTKFSN